MQNHWLHTGDRGYADANGCLDFAHRKKEAIPRPARDAGRLPPRSTG